MEILKNHRRHGAVREPSSVGIDAPRAVRRFLAHCPAYSPTPLLRLDAAAQELGVRAVLVKDEALRLGLQSFKALGGVYAILEVVAREASRRLSRPVAPADLLTPEIRAVAGTMTFACASDGNHGRSVAAGARLVGARSVVYLHGGVSDARAHRIAELGATVMRTDGNYDRSVEEAQEAARRNAWILVADTGESLADEIPGLIMRGYTAIADEVLDQIEAFGFDITHLFVQAGVGGLAAAMIGHLSARLGARAPRMIVVEPELACCLLESCRRGEETEIPQRESTIFAMLECNRPSPHAWQVLDAAADFFMSVPDSMAAPAMRKLAQASGGDPRIVSGESGAAGFAGLLCASADPAAREVLGLSADSVVLVINTEGQTDPGRYRELVECAQS